MVGQMWYSTLTQYMAKIGLLSHKNKNGSNLTILGICNHGSCQIKSSDEVLFKLMNSSVTYDGGVCGTGPVVRMARYIAGHATRNINAAMTIVLNYKGDKIRFKDMFGSPIVPRHAKHTVNLKSLHTCGCSRQRDHIFW